MTRVISVDAANPDPRSVSAAADILRSGGLVAIPTETVYGLAANALNAQAVERIFVAKGRPANNPLIVHVADVVAARELTVEWPEVADQLAARFWPGPLTMVLKKRSHVPGIVTGGGPTVAIRMPGHPVALALLRTTGFPLAAPSANTSNSISPTTAEHVLQSLRGRVNMILDAGPAVGGIESTVIDLTTEPARLLRPGLISFAELESIIEVIQCPSIRLNDDDGLPLPSPGTSRRHYAPRAVLECLPPEASARRVAQLSAAASGDGQRIGWLKIDRPRQSRNDRPDDEVDKPDDPGGLSTRVILMPGEPVEYARAIYAALHTLDAAGVATIVVDLPPNDAAWVAVRDRLHRAATIWTE